LHGHGTHVSGTIGGKTFGVAKQAQLWISRVLDANGSGSDSDVIRGIEWVVAKKVLGGDWVINMSLGGSDSPALNRAVCDAIAAGVVVAVAAGNESSDADTSSPARVRQAITVGAGEVFLGTDRQATFSNYGSLLDLYAPGVNILSAKPGGGTDTMSGTSMATPAVAGAVALYLQRHPGSSPLAVADGLVLYSTEGKLTNPGPGSPNRILFVKEN
jgi:subtilisin family serine protease